MRIRRCRAAGRHRPRRPAEPRSAPAAKGHGDAHRYERALTNLHAYEVSCRVRPEVRPAAFVAASPRRRAPKSRAEERLGPPPPPTSLKSLDRPAAGFGVRADRGSP